MAMSLLKGKDTVFVIPVSGVEEKTVYGTYKKAPLDPIEVKNVNVTNASNGGFIASEDNTHEVINEFRFVTGLGTWPGRSHSVIEFDDGKGDGLVKFDQIGNPQYFRRGIRTQHFKVRMRRRDSVVR